MYVTDIGCLHVFDFKHKKYSRFGGDVLNTPTGVALSPSGAIYVADSTADEIFIFSPGGVLIGQIKGVSTPGGIAFDNTRGRLICCETRKHDLAVFDAAGKLLFNIGKRGNGPGEFNFPYSVAVDREGRILVVDSGNFRVQVLAPDGSFIRAFGSVGILPGMFARPKGIALDSEGHLYVVDSAFGNFQIFDESGNIYLAVGSNGTDPGEFHLPTSIAINERDRIYVVDQLNRRIQVFQYLKDGG
jgi:DNA-binding beta-propeller fold protein YncE